MWVLEMGKIKRSLLLSTDTSDKQAGTVGYGWITDTRVLVLHSCDHSEWAAVLLKHLG